MHMECFKCRVAFATTPTIPCPDGIDGCLVAHYSDEQIWVCPDCGHDNQADYKAAWAAYKVQNPKAKFWPVREGIGIAVGNLKGLSKLKMTRDSSSSPSGDPSE